MKRRELLKTTGLVAVADLEALVGSSETNPSEDAYGEFLARLPSPSRLPDDRYDATFVRRLNEDLLPQPELFAGVDAHGRLVSRQVIVTMGLGKPPVPDYVDALENRGYRLSGRAGGRPLYARWDCYKHEIAVVDDDVVVVGRGPEKGPVEAFVRIVANPPDPRPIGEAESAVGSVLDRLEAGTILSVSPWVGPSGDGDHGDWAPRPLVSGERLSLRGQGVRLRTVAVYPSRAALDADVANTERLHGNASLDCDGRVIVHEWTVPKYDLPLVDGG